MFEKGTVNILIKLQKKKKEEKQQKPLLENSC